MRISDWSSDVCSSDLDANFTRSRLFLAGAAGLGRMSADDAERAAKELDLGIGAINSWTRAIDRAAAQNQPATVMLLAAVGMQGSDWRAVPPENLYPIVAALRATGLEGYARLIAAEAVGRVCPAGGAADRARGVEG